MPDVDPGQELNGTYPTYSWGKIGDKATNPAVMPENTNHYPPVN